MNNERNIDIAARVKATFESSKSRLQDRATSSGNRSDSDGPHVRRDQRESIEDVKKRMKADMEKLTGSQGKGMQGRNVTQPRSDIPDDIRRKLEERKISAGTRSTDEALRAFEKIQNRKSSTKGQQSPAEYVERVTLEHSQEKEQIQGSQPTQSDRAQPSTGYSRKVESPIKDEANFISVDAHAAVEQSRLDPKIGSIDGSGSPTGSVADANVQRSSGTTQLKVNSPLETKRVGRDIPSPRSSLPPMKERRVEAYSSPNTGGLPRGSREHASATKTQSTITTDENSSKRNRPIILGVDLLGAFDENPWN